MADLQPNSPIFEAPTYHDPKNFLGEGAFQELDGLSLREIMDCDSRPTLILDLDPDYIVSDKHAIRPIFCNAALRQHEQLLDNIMGVPSNILDPESDATTFDQFRTWATGISRHNGSKDIFPLTLEYRNLLWTGSTVRSRWRIISGNALFQTSSIPKGNLDSVNSHSEAPGQSSYLEIQNKGINMANPILPRSPLTKEPQLETLSATLSKGTTKITSTSSSVTLALPDSRCL